ncbi:putative transcription factor interactor and regulator Znf-B family [Helianthus annuus]|nr:putative transcription factor interactor and regulator Znf-B family [Helianthus annuus]
MKIQCDVCHKSEAVVYCTADEASLCSACDHCVHHANKLANKHLRFSLIHPSFKDSPRCDICQERRAFLFCKEDRAILCRECDIPIHKANEHTKKHTRFLLTGVKLSASLSCYDNSFQQTPSSSNSNGSVESTKAFGSSGDQRSASVNVNYPCSNYSLSQGEMDQTGSISEYLTETLPGWHVDQFLDCYGFGKFQKLIKFELFLFEKCIVWTLYGYIFGWVKMRITLVVRPSKRFFRIFFLKSHKKITCFSKKKKY